MFKSSFRFAATIVLAAAAAATLAAATPQLMPVDEAVSRPEFFSFRARLQAALARHDVDALMAVVDPDIKNSFGGDDGAEAFGRLWKPQAADSRIWNELATVLALGGSFEGPDSFVAPYISSKWPERFDAFEHVALVGSDVRIRTKPSAGAPAAAVLSFAILRLAKQQQDEGWQAVVLEGGQTAYVSAALVRSPIDQRAYFSRRSGQWRLTTFLAGD